MRVTYFDNHPILKKEKKCNIWKQTRLHRKLPSTKILWVKRRAAVLHHLDRSSHGMTSNLSEWRNMTCCQTKTPYNNKLYILNNKAGWLPFVCVRERENADSRLCVYECTYAATLSVQMGTEWQTTVTCPDVWCNQSEEAKNCVVRVCGEWWYWIDSNKWTGNTNAINNRENSQWWAQQSSFVVCNLGGCHTRRHGLLLRPPLSHNTNEM